MSRYFDGSVIYKHEAAGSQHKIIILDYRGNEFCQVIAPWPEEAKLMIESELFLKIKSSDASLPLRRTLQCCDKKGDGKFKMSADLIKLITEKDYMNGHIGLITQSEMSRIADISRQAINQKINSEVIESFEWEGLRMIPFDTVSTIETTLVPMVMYYKNSTKRPRRRRS